MSIAASKRPGQRKDNGAHFNRLNEFNYHYQAKQLAKAELIVKKDIACALEAGDIKSLEAIKSMRLLAMVLDDQGKHEEACAMYKTTVFVSLQAYGQSPMHMENFGKLAEMGGKCFLKMNQGQEAEKMFRIQLKVSENLLFKDAKLRKKYPSLVTSDANAITKCLVNLGDALRVQGKYTEAEATYMSALCKMEKNPVPSALEPKAVKNGLFVSQLKQWRLGEALCTLLSVDEAKLLHKPAA